MNRYQKILRGITMVGQLGFTIIAPPLLLIWVAHLLQTRFGLGSWLMLVAIVAGLISSGCSAWNFYQQVMKASKKQGKKDPPSTSFNNHQ